MLEFYEDPFMQLLEAIITWRDHAVETAVLEEARTTLQSLKAHPTHDHLIPQFELEIGNMEKRVAAQARRLIR